MSEFDFILTVLNDKEVRAETRDGAESKEEVELDSLRRRIISIFEDWLSQGKITHRQELEVLGSHLYAALFNGFVGKFFEQSLDKARKDRQRLVVQLGFTEEAADLANLPWEYLYYPGTGYSRGFFLSTHVDLVFSRYILIPTARPALAPEQSPLRILIIVSNPEDKDLAPVEEADQIIEVIQELTQSYPIQIDILDKPTIDIFLDKIEEAKPHVLHFIGHGRFNKADGNGEIALLDYDERSARWVKDDEFVDYFVHMHSFPRLVFLHLCEGGAIDFSAGYAGLAPQLVRAGVQAVVAMRYPIPNNAAIVFSRAFYRALAKGESIDVAVQEGRWRITSSIPSAYNNRVFGTPVLYMSSRDAVIRPVEETASIPSKQVAEEISPEPISSLNDVLLVFNGINGSSGDYLLPPMTAKQIANIVQNEKQDPEQLQELQSWYRRFIQAEF